MVRLRPVLKTHFQLEGEPESYSLEIIPFLPLKEFSKHPITERAVAANSKKNNANRFNNTLIERLPAEYTLPFLHTGVNNE